MKNKLMFIIAILLGLLASFLVYDYLVKLEKNMTNIQYQQVVVAAKDVGSKTKITADMLETKKVPLDYVHPQALAKTEEALGAVTLGPLVQGEQILTKKIARPNDVKNGLSYIIPQGKRALTIAVDEVSGLAGFLRPGDRVDVVATVNVPQSAGQQDIPHALVVMQDIQVLAVDRTLDEKGDAKMLAEPKTVTVAVSVEQARPLVLASQKGTIRLMLRSPVDNSTVYTTPFKALDFLQ